MLYPPVTVALARRVPTLPTVAGWTFEPKFDGHRQVLFRTEEGVLLQSRSGRLVGASYPDLVEAAEFLPVGTVLDGEAVIIRGGRPDFGAVQSRAASTPAHAGRLARELPATYAGFDILAYDGEDRRGMPQRARRAILLDVLAGLTPSPLQAVPATTDVDAAAAIVLDLAAAVEGVVCKRLNGLYRGGHRDWLKVKHDRPRSR